MVECKGYIGIMEKNMEAIMLYKVIGSFQNRGLPSLPAIWILLEVPNSCKLLNAQVPDARCRKLSSLHVVT